MEGEGNGVVNVFYDDFSDRAKIKNNVESLVSFHLETRKWPSLANFITYTTLSKLQIKLKIGPLK